MAVWGNGIDAEHTVGRDFSGRLDALRVSPDARSETRLEFKAAERRPIRQQNTKK